jgi:tetratricopeptide (TPR) repeat protein
MLSFALNYYFAGSFADPTPFKITNLVIHAVNGLLVFWMMQLVFTRLTALANPNRSHDLPGMRQVTWAAFTVALLWLIHPIQISSVLYVVQRMTELAALFTLAGLIAYLKGRASLQASQTRRGAALLVASLGLFLPLGLLAKENAVLLPVYVLVIEFVLFSGEPPWNRWQGFTPFQRRLFVSGLALLAVIGLVAVMRYALPMYASRRFDLVERLLTEGRVLFFYLSLILLPRIDQFGNQHDDIAISVSLFDPWTTLPALLGHAGLLATAWLARKRLPFLSLGILWFYAGHLLESTVIALEIAHEHRNYLPALGVMLAIVGSVHHLATRLRIPRLAWLIPVIAIVFAGVTLQRASQWGDEDEFYRYEALHHPDSARIQTGYARSLAAQGHDEQAISALRRAAEIDPRETGTLIQIVMLEDRQGKTPSPSEQEKILARLRSSEPLTDVTFMEVKNITGCLATSCRVLQTPMEQWLRTILERKTSPGDVSFYHYALGLTLASQGKLNEALRELHRSQELDPSYLHPLFAMASIYVRLGVIEGAEEVLKQLRAANKNNPHPRTREIAAVAADIEKLKGQRK